MLAAIFAAIASFQEILLRENNVAFSRLVKVVWI